jgi:SAM-dependent methyltransferase
MKQHHILLYILIGLSLLLCLRYLGENYVCPIPPVEGFQQDKPYVLKENAEIYDDFYVEKYDQLYQPQKRNNFEVKQIIRMTQPDLKHSCFLDIGSGTGSLVQELMEAGYRTYGIDTSKAMIDYSQTKYPEIQVEYGDANEIMLFDMGTFTHVICNYLTIYQFKDKLRLLKNAYRWLTPGGYFILHLVDPNRFDTIIPAGKSLNVDSPKRYTFNRVSDEFFKFDDFKYKSKVDMKLNQTKLLETFTDETNKVRQNEQNLFMEPKETILAMAKLCGFILHGQLNYETLYNDPYQYLIILERPM